MNNAEDFKAEFEQQVSSNIIILYNISDLISDKKNDENIIKSQQHRILRRTVNRCFQEQKILDWVRQYSDDFYNTVKTRLDQIGASLDS